VQVILIYLSNNESGRGSSLYLSNNEPNFNCIKQSSTLSAVTMYVGLPWPTMQPDPGRQISRQGHIFQSHDGGIYTVKTM